VEDCEVKAQALVTGASSGIGRAYATAWAARGHDLVLVARREERLRELAAELGEKHGVAADVVVADLRREDDRARVAERAAGCGILVNNAGFSGYGAFAEIAPSVAADLVGVHVLATLAITRAALPRMLASGDGVIVNVASGLAFSGSLDPAVLPGRATYSAAKSFVVTFSRVLAGEVEGRGLRVQALCPGRTTSEFHPGEPPRDNEMSAEDVVVASLTGLDRGELVCLPGLEDASLVEELGAVERTLLTGNNRAQRSGRYVART
jgi:short-subunit dehydrogenase